MSKFENMYKSNVGDDGNRPAFQRNNAGSAGGLPSTPTKYANVFVHFDDGFAICSFIDTFIMFLFRVYNCL